MVAASLQEEFDCSFNSDLHPNLIAGYVPVGAEVRRALANRVRSQPPGSYYVDTDGLAGPHAGVIRQFQSCAWARLDQRAYAIFNYLLVAVLLVLIVVEGIRSSWSVDELVLDVITPLTPFFVGRLQAATDFGSSSHERKRIRDICVRDLQAGPPTLSTWRAIQDQLFYARRDGRRVPGWFYRLLRSGRLSAVDAEAAQYVSNAQSG